MMQEKTDLAYWDRHYRPKCMQLLNQWRKLSPSGNARILTMLVDKELGMHPDLAEYIRVRRGAYMDPHRRLLDDVRDEQAFQDASSFF